MMANTGILLRGGTFNEIFVDPPVTREATLAGSFLGISGYWINLPVLSKLGEVTDSQGSFTAGFKTSDLPITYDAGYLQEDTDALLVNGNAFRVAPLSALEVLSSTSFKFDGIDIDVAMLNFLTTYKATIDFLSQTDITVTFTCLKVLVRNETTGIDLGEVTTSGDTLTFSSTQNIGDEITVRTVDSHYNKGIKTYETV